MKSLFNYLKSQISSLVIGHVSYFDGTHHLLAGAEIRLRKSDRSGLICILSRACYSEEVVWYPVSTRKDLSNLANVKMEQDKQVLVFHIGRSVEGKTPITYFKTDVPRDLLSNAKVVIPETLLMAFGLPVKNDTIYRFSTMGSDERVLLLKNGAAIQSSLAKGLFANVSHFAMAFGLVADQAVDIDKSACLSALKNGVLKPHRWFDSGLLLRRSGQRDYKKQWVVGGALLAAITLYLYASQFLAKQFHDASKTEAASLLSKAGEAITLRNEIEENSAYYTDLASMLPPNNRFILILAVLEIANQSGAVVQYVGLNGKEVLLRIESKSVSSVLQQFIASPYVESAEFETPIRKVYDKERVAIKLLLVNQGQ